jgi:hypothetical protein
MHRTRRECQPFHRPRHNSEHIRFRNQPCTHASIMFLDSERYVLFTGNMSVNIIGQATALENRRPPLDAVEWPELRNVIQVSSKLVFHRFPCLEGSLFVMHRYLVTSLVRFALVFNSSVPTPQAQRSSVVQCPLSKQ